MHRIPTLAWLLVWLFAVVAPLSYHLFGHSTPAPFLRWNKPPSHPATPLVLPQIYGPLVRVDRFVLANSRDGIVRIDTETGTATPLWALWRERLVNPSLDLTRFAIARADNGSVLLYQQTVLALLHPDGRTQHLATCPKIEAIAWNNGAAEMICSEYRLRSGTWSTYHWRQGSPARAIPSPPNYNAFAPPFGINGRDQFPMLLNAFQHEQRWYFVFRGENSSLVAYSFHAPPMTLEHHPFDSDDTSQAIPSLRAALDRSRGMLVSVGERSTVWLPTEAPGISSVLQQRQPHSAVLRADGTLQWIADPFTHSEGPLPSVRYLPEQEADRPTLELTTRNGLRRRLPVPYANSENVQQRYQLVPLASGAVFLLAPERYRWFRLDGRTLEPNFEHTFFARLLAMRHRINMQRYADVHSPSVHRFDPRITGVLHIGFLFAPLLLWFVCLVPSVFAPKHSIAVWFRGVLLPFASLGFLCLFASFFRSFFTLLEYL